MLGNWHPYRDLSRDGTRAPMQVRNGWRPHGRLLDQPAALSKNGRFFVQPNRTTSKSSVQNRTASSMGTAYSLLTISVRSTRSMPRVSSFRCICALLSAGLFSQMAVRASYLYAGDFSSGNGSVNFFNAVTGAFVLNTTVPGNTMSFPGQIANGPNGNLYVADAAGAVDVFNPTTGAYLTQFGSSQLVSVASRSGI